MNEGRWSKNFVNVHTIETQGVGIQKKSQNIFNLVCEHLLMMALPIICFKKVAWAIEGITVSWESQC